MCFAIDVKINPFFSVSDSSFVRSFKSTVCFERDVCEQHISRVDQTQSGILLGLWHLCFIIGYKIFLKEKYFYK